MPKWYLKKSNGKVSGPYSESQILAGLEKKKIPANIEAGKAIEGPWIPVQELSEQNADVLLLSNEVSPQEMRSLFDEVDTDVSPSVNTFPVHAVSGTAAQVSLSPTAKTSLEKEQPKETATQQMLRQAREELNEKKVSDQSFGPKLPNSISYILHTIIALFLSVLFALMCLFFGFIPLGYLYKHFYNKDEEVIAYIYLVAGILSSIGSVLILGFVWQGSLEFGESIYNAVTGENSQNFNN